MSADNFLTQIYSDGFKGLPDGWKSLKRVNFIVGENSSGKTSLFDLLEILAASDFSFLNQILGVVEGLQDADDVIRRSKRKKEVTVGYLRPTGESNSHLETYLGMIVTYAKTGSDLKISRLTTILGRNAYKIKIAGKRMMGKLFPAPSINTSIKNLCTLALAAHNDTSKGYSVMFDLDDQGPPAEQMWVAAKMNSFEKMDAFEEPNSEKNQKRPRRSALGYFINAGYEIFRYGPIRSETTKIITASSKSDFETSGGHFPHRLKQLGEANPRALKALKEFGRESGLFDDVRIERLVGGKTEAFSILYSKNQTEFHANELGYGLGQIMPIVTDLLVAKSGETYLIQQPEVHLHPKAQAAFGNFIHEVGDSGPVIVVETHSDFLIDRFRISRSQKTSKVEAQVLFFEHVSEKKSQKFSSIVIEEDGSLRNPPSSYRSFFVNEAISVFEAL